MGNQSLLILTSSFSRTVVIKLNFSLESLEELLKTILIFRADFLSSGSKHTPETKSISIVWKPVEMQILRPHPRPASLEPEGRPSHWGLSLPEDFFFFFFQRIFRLLKI